MAEYHEFVAKITIPDYGEFRISRGLVWSGTVPRMVRMLNICHARKPGESLYAGIPGFRQAHEAYAEIKEAFPKAKLILLATPAPLPDPKGPIILS